MNVRGIAQAATLAVASSLLVLGIQQPAAALSPDIVISQVYGGGGNSGATLRNDFIELYNRGTETVPIEGWSVQYASAAGTTWQITALTGQIPPGEHYLVQEAQGTGGTVALPTPDATGTIPMSGTAGKVALVTSSSGLTCVAPNCDTDPAVRDFVGYGAANDSETAPTPTLSSTTAAQRAADGATDTDNNSADFTVGAPNPRNCGEACGTVPPPPPPPPASYEIAAIQGESTSTPIPGTTVRTEGIVTGDFNGTGGLGGFYIQDDTPDTNPATSDGIFVASSTAVSAGDRVQVDGTATETFGETQLTNATVTVTGTGSIAPLAYDLPRPENTTFEPVEGVLLTFPEALTVTELFALGRFGELALSSDGRLYQPTDRVEPGPAAQALAAENQRRRLLLDDASNVQNPAVVPYTKPDPVRIGDTTTGVTGVVGFGFSSYRLQPTAPVTFTETNPRPAAPEDVGGDIQVASFNTLNYFTTLTTENPNARGANSSTEFARQQQKEVAAILGIDAEVLGLMEVENNGSEAIASLVQALNDATAPGTYAYITEPVLNAPNQFGGTFGTDAIKVAIIYKPAAVTPIGEAQSSADPIFDRPPLIQTFERVGGSEPVSVVVNHFKSKSCGSPAPPITDPNGDQGDGQGCFNARRIAQANALLSDLGTLNAPRPLIIGDLNAYTEEDPIHALEDAGYVGLSELFVDAAERYSFVFDGLSGELDHGLASPDLVGDVTGATIWHINADEPLVLDYNLDFGRDPTLYEPNAYRSSDHDPLIVGLSLQADTPPAAPVVSVVVGPNAATVSWTAPADGGSPITGYTVSVRQGDTVVESVDVGADVLSYTFGGLTNGVAYQFEVVATNAIGDGVPASVTGTPIVPAGYQRLDARLACPGFTVTNSNAFPVSYSWKAGGRSGVGVVEAGETAPIVGADASVKQVTLVVRTSAVAVDDRVVGRCR